MSKNHFTRSQRTRKSNSRGDRTKCEPTPKRSAQQVARLRPYTRTDMIISATGWQQVVPHPRLSRDAVHDAIEALNIDDSADRAELIYLASDDRTKAELIRHMDVFAARYPDDSRWDTWRRYRRTRNAVLS